MGVNSLEVQLVQFLAQNKDLLMPIIILIFVLFLFRKNEKMTQYAIAQSEEREKSYNELINDVMEKGEKREEALMDTINGQLCKQTDALVNLSSNIDNVCKTLGDHTVRINRVEQELNIKEVDPNEVRKAV